MAKPKTKKTVARKRTRPSPRKVVKAPKAKDHQILTVEQAKVLDKYMGEWLEKKVDALLAKSGEREIFETKVDAPIKRAPLTTVAEIADDTPVAVVVQLSDRLRSAINFLNTSSLDAINSYRAICTQFSPKEVSEQNDVEKFREGIYEIFNKGQDTNHILSLCAHLGEAMYLMEQLTLRLRKLTAEVFGT